MADVGTTFCMDLGGVAGGGVATGADYIAITTIPHTLLHTP